MIINKKIVILIGSLIGGLGGFLYWKFVGCATGTCPLTSNWMIMTGYGILIGYFLSDIIPVKKKQYENSNTNL
ncbi:MAG: hypothetical protein WC358_09160 [Ignavibacteria bacterium]